MNSVLSFLNQNWQRFELDRFGNPAELTCVLITPQFRASRHVVFFITSKQAPILIAKIPRLPGDDAVIVREAANLQAAHACRPGGFDSIPQLIAIEDSLPYPILVETALIGRPLNPAMIRRNRFHYSEKVVNWLIDFQQAGRVPSESETGWYDRLVTHPLNRFAESVSMTSDDRNLLDQTREIASALRDSELSLVFEHGDLSDPNLLLTNSGTIGVLDWELAVPHGLPASDLFFFLNYAAASAASRKDPLKRFHETFFTRSSWIRPLIHNYAEQFSLSAELLTPLFVLCWARRVACLSERIRGGDRQLSDKATSWLKSHRYFSSWQYAVTQAERLHWE